MKTTDDYALGRTERETQRLIFQARIYAPTTRRFFQAAGIGRGMRVLDIGSGAGDVAMLVADLVGPGGQVDGVDMNADILETARARVESVGMKNVRFQSGDVREVRLDSDYDAVVGRWVLMYVPKPAELIRHLVTRLRVGGIVAFHENDFTYPPTVFPESEISKQIQKWTIPPPGAPGPDMRTGTKLLRLYQEAGLPVPELIVEAVAGGGPNWSGYEYLAETLRSLLPALQKMTGLDPDEVDIDTLADRLREDVVSRKAIQMHPLMFGAWARKPA